AWAAPPQNLSPPAPTTVVFNPPPPPFYSPPGYLPYVNPFDPYGLLLNPLALGVTPAQLRAVSQQSFFTTFNQLQWGAPIYSPLFFGGNPLLLGATASQLQALSQLAFFRAFHPMQWGPQPILPVGLPLFYP